MQGAVQYLKHGKALCGKVFANFVETFNHLVDFTVNLKGDADLGKEGGKIHVDRSDPDHPVIRFSEGEGNSGSGSGVSAADGSGITVTDGVIDLSGRSDSDTFAVRETTLADGSVVKVLRTANDVEQEEEEEEKTDDDGHPTSDANGDDPDPSDLPEEEDPDFDPEDFVPDGGVPDCGDGGGVPAGGWGDGMPGGVPADGDSHSGDGCTGC